jgi:predicted nucleic acid-binding protein
VIVVDASVIVTALADDGGDGDRVRDRLRSERLIAPHVVDLEVASACGVSPPQAGSTSGASNWQ